jgi:polyisoprenoid-binding protein YceI
VAEQSPTSALAVRQPLRRGKRPGGWRDRHPGVEWLLAAVGLLALGVVLGPLAYFHLVEGNAPGKLALPRAAGTSSQVAPGPLSGNWMVAAGSQSGYRVQEILFGQSHTAVGRTSQVTGGITISGTTVTAADFTVDMGSVKSDQAGRNVQFDSGIMDTGRYPYGRFHLTRPVQLGSVPPVGQILAERATGDLTLRGVTRTVSFVLHAERFPSAIDVDAEIPIVFSRWHIPNPSFAITRVGNVGTIEVLLHLVPAGATR